MQWLLIIVQATISGAGVLLLRYASQRFSGLSSSSLATWITGGLGTVLYGVSFLLWVYILSKTPATYAFPLTIGISLGVTTVGAILLFGERLTVIQGLGMLLLVVAVVLIGAFGKSTN